MGDVKLKFLKDPTSIQNSLKAIISDYNSFHSYMKTASKAIEVMKKNWFGPNCNSFMTNWNSNIGVTNKNLSDICDCSERLNARFKNICSTLGFTVNKLSTEKLHLDKFDPDRKQTGTYDSSALQTNLTNYLNGMNNSLKVLKDNLINKNLKPETIGVLDLNGGGLAKDLESFTKCINGIHTGVEDLLNNTKKYVEAELTAMSSSNA